MIDSWSILDNRTSFHEKFKFTTEDTVATHANIRTIYNAI